MYCQDNTVPSDTKSATAGFRRRQGTSLTSQTQGIPSWKRRSPIGFPGGPRDRADALVPPSPQSRPSTRSVRAWRRWREVRPLRGPGLRLAERLGLATARMEDSQLFCVAEERSGHCAVVDGNFLYVWGGYVVRGRGGTGPTRVGSPPGFSDRADAERLPTPSPEAGAGLRPRLSATRPSLRCRPLFQPCKGLTPPRGCSHYESLPTLCGVSSLQSPPPPQLFSNPSLPNTKSVTARLSSLNACGDLKVHRGRRAVLLCKYFLIATTRLEMKYQNHI